MNLTIDIGNTCTKLVAFDNQTIVEARRIEHGEYALLHEFAMSYSFDAGICSSVIDIDDDTRNTIDGLPFEVIYLESGVTPIPILNKYKTPFTLGSDRLAAAVGAYMRSQGHDVLVVDIGTCITYDFVTSRGEYLGGNISPGPRIRLSALHEHTGKLPLVSRRGDTPSLGYDTTTAIRSGVLRGVEYELRGYIEEFSEKYPSLLVYLTGGVRLDLHISEKKCIFADDFIVPEGLNRILTYNKELSQK